MSDARIATPPSNTTVAGAFLAALSVPVLVDGLILWRVAAANRVDSYAQLPGAVVILCAVIMGVAGVALLARERARLR